MEGGIDKGSVTLAWVSKFFRRATLEIDTLVGAVRPAPVPDGSGGMEFFDTAFAKTGWRLTVVQDQLNVPVPAGVVPTNCWSSPDLHALMTTVRNPSTNLDTEWHVHMIVVPAELGCSRGIMYECALELPSRPVSSVGDDLEPFTTFHGRFCFRRFSIWSTACESRLMRDAVTILVVHVSRQQGQSLLHVGQEFRLKAGPDFLQRINEPGHFVGPDPTIQRQSIEPGHLPPHPGKRIQRHRIMRG